MMRIAMRVQNLKKKNKKNLSDVLMNTYPKNTDKMVVYKTSHFNIICSDLNGGGNFRKGGNPLPLG